MKSNEFQCEQCKGIFEEEWSEEETLAEYENRGGGPEGNNSQVQQVGSVCQEA